MSASVEPRASRPDMPGYGILAAEAGRGLLPWSWAAERLAKARTYWLATTRPDGRPHAMPVWGVWLAGRDYSPTSPPRAVAASGPDLVLLYDDPDCAVAAKPAGLHGSTTRHERAPRERHRRGAGRVADLPLGRR